MTPVGPATPALAALGLEPKGTPATRTARARVRPDRGGPSRLQRPGLSSVRGAEMPPFIMPGGGGQTAGRRERGARGRPGRLDTVTTTRDARLLFPALDIVPAHSLPSRWDRIHFASGAEAATSDARPLFQAPPHCPAQTPSASLPQLLTLQPCDRSICGIYIYWHLGGRVTGDPLL